MSKTIYATFQDAASAERAVGALLDHGARKEDVSVISSHDPTIWRPAEAVLPYTEAPIMGYNPSMGTVAVPPVYTDPVSETPIASPIDPYAPEYARPINDNSGPDGRDLGPDTARESDEIAKHGITTTTGADAERGAVEGAAWGAAVGIVAGLSALIVPGIGLVYGGGALALAILGAVGSTAAGAVAGAAAGFLVDQGVEPHLAEKYAASLQRGQALIAVTVPTGPLSEENVDFLLRKYEALEVETAGKKHYLL